MESSEEGAHQDYQACAAHQLWLRATPPHAWECSCTTPGRTTTRMCGPHAPPALLGFNRLEKHNSAKSENVNIKRHNAKFNMHMRKLRVALRACGTPPGHAAWAHIPRSAGRGLHARNTTSAAKHTKLPNKASTSPEPHGTNELRKSQRPPAPPNRLPRPPPRRTAEGMRCCGSGTGVASTQQRHESVPKRNTRQPTHCTRTACRHNRPEGQPGACGAAGARWDDKRTGTPTTPQPQRTSRRPEEMQRQIKHAHARAACCAARLWAHITRSVRQSLHARNATSAAKHTKPQGQHIARATWHQPSTKKPTPRS